MNLRPIFQQLVDAAIILYSLLVISSSAPSLRALSSLLVVPYYIFVPGYTMTTAFSSEARTIGTAFNSFVWSLALVASVISLQSISPASQALPLSVIVPGLTLLFFTFGHFHRR